MSKVTEKKHQDLLISTGFLSFIMAWHCPLVLVVASALSWLAGFGLGGVGWVWVGRELMERWMEKEGRGE